MINIVYPLPHATGAEFSVEYRTLDIIDIFYREENGINATCGIEVRNNSPLGLRPREILMQITPDVIQPASLMGRILFLQKSVESIQQEVRPRSWQLRLRCCLILRSLTELIGCS